MEHRNMGRFRRAGKRSFSTICFVAGALLGTFECKLIQRPSKAELWMLIEQRAGSMSVSPVQSGDQADRLSLMSVSRTVLATQKRKKSSGTGAQNNTDPSAYSFKDLKDNYGFSDEEIRKYSSRDEQTPATVQQVDASPLVTSASGDLAGSTAASRSSVNSASVESSQRAGERTASPIADRVYTYSELRNDLGMSDDQILNYFKGPSAARHTSPVTTLPPQVEKTYTYTELRNQLGFTDDQILDYYSTHASANRMQQRTANSPTGLGVSNVTSETSLSDDRVYTYSELRNQLGFNDEQILDYYMKHDSSIYAQSVNSHHSSGIANLSVIPPLQLPTRVYTYSEMHDELGLSDEQILNYYSKMDFANRPAEEKPSDSMEITRGTPAKQEVRTYTYAELRNELGYNDEQILAYYLEHDPVSRMKEQRDASARSVVDRVYTYSELHDEFGLTDQQILDYSMKHGLPKRTLQYGSERMDDFSGLSNSASPVEQRTYTYSELRDELGLTDDQIQNYYSRKSQGETSQVQNASSFEAVAEALSHSAVVGRVYTYSELRDVFGFSDDQILDFYSQIEGARQAAATSASLPLETAKSVPKRTRAGKPYTYSELRDVLGLSDAQIQEYYSDNKGTEQVSQESSAAPLPGKTYTYLELRDDFGYTPQQIIDYYRNESASSRLESISDSGSSFENSSQIIPRQSDTLYTYSHLRDEFGLSDEQIMAYYSRERERRFAAARAMSPNATVVDRTYTYAELRDVFGFTDDEILDYYKHAGEDPSTSASIQGVDGSINSSILESLGATDAESQPPPGRSNDESIVRPQRRGGKSYTYSELRDTLGWSNERIMNYFASEADASIAASHADKEAPEHEELSADQHYTYFQLRDDFGLSDKQILDYFEKVDREKGATQQALSSTEQSASIAPLSLLEISKRDFPIVSSASSTSTSALEAPGKHMLSPINGKDYTYSELRNLGFSDDQVLDYFAKADVASSRMNSRSKADRGYTYKELRDDLGYSDAQILDYYIGNDAAQRDVSRVAAIGNDAAQRDVSRVAAKPLVPAQEGSRAYTYTELRDMFGLTDQEIFDYFAEIERTKHSGSDNASLSNASTFSFSGSRAVSSAVSSGRTYTYAELRDDLQFTDKEILEYYTKLESASSTDSSKNSSRAHNVGKVYTYSELRDELGLSDEQILAYYSRRDQHSIVDPAKSRSSVNSSILAKIGKVYTYSELRDDLGLNEDQIVDYFKEIQLAKHSVVEKASFANATTLAVPAPVHAGKVYTYSELQDVFGFSDDQILSYYSDIERAKQAAAITGNFRGATDNSTIPPARAGKTYTYSEMRDVLGFSDKQILDYFSINDPSKQIPQQIDPSGGVPLAREVSSVAPTGRVFTDSEVRDAFGSRDDRTLDSRAQTERQQISRRSFADSSEKSFDSDGRIATSPESRVDDGARAVQARADGVYTYSELRDGLGWSDAQILDYYARHDQALTEPRVGVPVPQADNLTTDDASSKHERDSKAYTYSELRDVLGLSDAQIRAYYSKQLGAHQTPAIGDQSIPVNTELPAEADANRDSLSSAFGGKKYTYSEMRDNFGWSDARILEYYSKLELEKAALTNAGEEGVPIDVALSQNSTGMRKGLQPISSVTGV